jgi:putative N6-adenine-specific DNA methylase
MTYQYQKTNRYFAQVADDIKDIAANELQGLGASEIKPVYRGLYIDLDKESLYNINYQSRLINRVLAPLLTFKCHSDNYLYQTALKIAWDDFFGPDNTFAVFASVSHSSIRHSKFAALRLKDAVADYFMDKTKRRPSVDTHYPDIWLNLHIEQNEAVISIDTSGGSLHRRGYRKTSVQAPMMETLAAAIIQYSEWDGTKPLHAPFCGSGTILCEGWMHATQTPAGILRDNFGFRFLPEYDDKLWQTVKKRADSNIKSIPDGLITGSDKNNKAVRATLSNCEQIDTNGSIKVRRDDVFSINSLENKTIICNPPYGIRLNDKNNLDDFYKRLGDFLKQRCHGSTAFIYFGERSYLKNIGLRSSWKKILSNGGLDGRLAKFELY